MRSSAPRSRAAGGCAAAATGPATSPSPPTARRCSSSVGSHSNNDDTDNNPDELHRADILEMNPDGTGLRVYAWGIRNPVGIAFHPRSGELWTSVNERDRLGDDLVPDYITHVKEGGFYGWPWFYIGGNIDPRHAGKHPELRDKVIVPDVLLQAHHASLELTFYEGKQFPAEYAGDIFAAAARVVEPRPAHRLQRRARAAAPDRARDRRLSRLPDRLRHRRRSGLGATGGRRGRARRRADGQRRRLELDLARQLHRQVAREPRGRAAATGRGCCWP